MKRFLDVQNLNLFVNGQWLLNKFSLQVEYGQRIGITGPSGCGKTTFLRSIISGEPPEGSSFQAFEVQRQGLGYAPQVAGLFPWLCVRRNLEFFVKKRYVSHESQSTIEPIVEDFGLEECIDNYPSQLSGGEYQRSVLACAIIISPEIFIIDEPLTGVDFRMKWSVLESLSRRITENRGTLILVSHDSEILSYLCDHVITLGKRPAVIKKTFNFAGRHPRRRMELMEGSLMQAREDLLNWLLADEPPEQGSVQGGAG